MKKRIISFLLSITMIAGACFPSMPPVHAAASTQQVQQVQEIGNLNYFSNQGKLNENAFVQLPMGAVEAKDWLKQQLYLQKNGLTGAIHDQYSLYGPDNGWRGGKGDGWEKGAYYLRGLTSLAWVLGDEELKGKAMEWIDFILDSQRENGFMGPVNDGDGSSDNWDWWPRMVILQVIRDYYEATEQEGKPDERVLPFFEKYFRYQLQRLPGKPLNSWAASRGGDNIEVLLWYYNRAYDESDPTATDWIIDLASVLASQTKSQDSGLDWNAVFNDTTVREHVVNTTQAMKTPAVLSQLPGHEGDVNSLKQGIFNMGLDHGRVDNLANADEGARENYPYRGAELCSVVESLLSNEMSIRITGESWLGDQIEQTAYNNLPAGYAPDYTGHNYFQAQNQVLGTHGNHEFDCDHGDDSAYGALTGFECCFPNMHMGWPKFVQSMWMATKDNGLAVVAYGPNQVTAKVADGKTAVFEEVTDYPFKDTIALNYSGDTAKFPLKLRLPAWCEKPEVTINGVTADLSVQEKGFAVLNREWKPGDQVSVTFPMKVRTSTWFNNSQAVEYGPLIFAVKVEEDWRIGTDDAAKEIQYDPVGEFDRKEVYPASDWNYGLVLNEADPEGSFEITAEDEISLQPFILDNAPITMKVKGQLIPQWKLKGNVVPEPPYSPIAPDESLQREIELVPYGCTRIRITQIPVIGEPSSDGVTERTLEDAQIYEENGTRVTEFDNIVMPFAEDYTLRISYEGSGSMEMNINQKYSESVRFDGSGTMTAENLCEIVPGTNRYFHFGYGKYNNIRFFGKDVTITKLEILPVDLFTQPEIYSAVISKDGTSVTLNTNIDRADGFYTVHYGTESGNYTRTAENFFDKKAVLTGLTPGEDYYFQISMLVNGVEKVTEEVKAVAAKEQPLSFKDDFSDPAASKKQWTLYDPKNVVTFEEGKMSVGSSDNIKAMTGEQQWKDYAVVARLTGTGKAERDFGIILRASDIGDGSDGYKGYYVGINAIAEGLNIGYADGGWNGIAAPGGITYEEGKTYELKTIIAGERLAVYVDGVKLYDELISNMRSGDRPVSLYESGSAGVRSWNQSFDVNSFEVREISQEEYAELGIENHLFEDDFSSAENSRTKWTVYDPDGAVEFTDGGLKVGNSKNLKIMAGTGEEEWENYAVETKLKGPQNPQRDFGVMFRCTDVTEEGADSYFGYYVGIDAIGGGLNVGYANGGWNDIEKVRAFQYEPGKVYELKILVCGNQFKVYVDGQQYYEFTDDKFPYGSVGLRSWNQPFEAGYFKVRRLTAEEEGQFDQKTDPNVPEEVVPQFSDDFEDTAASAEKWRLCGDKSRMKFEAGKLSMGSSDNVKAVAGDENWKDYVAEVSVALDAKGEQNAGLMYRVTGVQENGSDGYNGYYYGIGNNRDGTGYFIIGYADGDWHQTMRKNLPAFEAGTEYVLKAVVYGDRIALYLDDQMITRFVDPRYASGMIGLRSYDKAFTADNVTVRSLTDADKAGFDGMSRYIEETFGAYKTIQLKFPKFSSSKNYKIIYGTEPGNYTNEVYNLNHWKSGSRSDKQGLTLPENDQAYYLKLIALDGKEETTVSDEVMVHTGDKPDLSEELEKLSVVLKDAEQTSQDGMTEESSERLNWAIAYAKEVAGAPDRNLMEVRLAKNSLLVGKNELEEDTNAEVLPVKVKLEAENAQLAGVAKLVERGDASGGYKVGMIDNQDATVTYTLKAPKDGSYRIELATGSGADQPNASHMYYVNGQKDQAKIVTYQPNGWDNWSLYPVEVELKKGENTFTVTHSGRENSFSELDYIIFYTSNPKVDKITLDGEALEGFERDTLTYQMKVQDLEKLPKVAAELSPDAAEEFEVTVIQGREASVTLTHKKDKTFTLTYQVRFYDDRAFDSSIVNFGADPYVTYQDGYYYYCRVLQDKAIYVSKAKELNRIAATEPQLVYTPAAGEPNRELWAPEMHYMNGKWYIYYTAGAGADHRMYVLESKTGDALGEYEFKGKLAPETDRWAIDQTVLEYGGKLYAVWSGWEGTTNVSQRIYIAEMSDPLTITGERAELSRPEYSWELDGTPTINEGAQIAVSPEGVVNIIYSASGSWTDNYCLGRLTLRGENPMNPEDWEKGTESVFHKSAPSTYSTGHACFTKSPDGTEDYIVYHATRGAGQGWNGRGVRTQMFTWNEDGTPHFGTALAYDGKVNMPSGTETDKRSRYEAEEGTLLGGAAVEETYNSSGKKKVTGLRSDGDGVSFTVEAQTAGIYHLYLGAATKEEGAGLELQVNGAQSVKKNVLPFNAASGGGLCPDNWIGYEFSVTLAKGENNIDVRKMDGQPMPDLDYLDMELEEEIKADKTELQEVYDLHKGKQETDYTPKSWKAFGEALDQAKTLLEDEHADQSQVDLAVKALVEAARKLVRKDGQVTEEDLQEAVKKAEEARGAAEEAKKLAEQAQAEAKKQKEEAEAAKKAALEAQKRAEEMADASKEEREKAQAEAEEARKQAEAAEKLVKDAEKAVQAAEKARKAAEEAAEVSSREAEAVRAELTAAKEEIEKAREEAQKAREEADRLRRAAEASAKEAEEALKALQEKQKEQETVNSVKVGEIYPSGNLKYLVTSVSEKTVSVTGASRKNLKAITVPASITIEGDTYRVTAISKNAFFRYKRLQKITIGKNVTSIGSKAFYRDAKLKTIVVRAEKLVKIGKNAWKGIYKKAVIRTPQKKKKAYAKLLKKSGIAKTVKIK